MLPQPSPSWLSEGLVCGIMMICFLGYHRALTRF